MAKVIRLERDASNAAAPPDEPTLDELFYSGEHKAVLRRTVDSAAGDYADEHVHLVVGALVFTGRSDEAATIFRSWDRGREGSADTRERAAACRFFLCIAECRAGRYVAAERLSLASLLELRGTDHFKTATARARHYVHQGLGLVRHFTGRMGSAARHAARARAFALEARFPYGRMLSLDLLGHTLVQTGRVASGLTVLEQAAELAETIGLESIGMTTRSAIVAYRAHFGAEHQNPIESLTAHLAKVGETDRYSKRLVLIEIAKAYALRGERERAASELRVAEDVALPDGDRRAAVKLYVAHALVAGLSVGEVEAEEWLGRARPLVDPTNDTALDIEIAWAEYMVAPSRFERRGEEELRRVAIQTGIARAAYLAFAGSDEPDRPLPIEDRFAALIRRARRDGMGALDVVLANDLLGLLPMCGGRKPGVRIYIDVTRGLFALEEHGTVVRRPMPSESLRALLRELAKGPRSKELLIQTLWGIRIYRPEAHDAVIHTAISRLRGALEPHASWVQMSGNGYELLSGVELVELSVIRPLEPEVRTELETEAAPEPPPATQTDTKPTDPRRALILELAARPSGIATRELSERLKCSEMTALRLLAAMTDDGALERAGRGRNTRYTRRG